MCAIASPWCMGHHHASEQQKQFHKEERVELDGKFDSWHNNEVIRKHTA